MGIAIQYRHPYRGLGLATFALLASCLASLSAAVSQKWSGWNVAITSTCLSVAFVRLAMFLDHFHGSRRLGLGLAAGALSVIGILAGAAIEQYGEYRGLGIWRNVPYRFTWVPVATGVATVFALVMFFRPVFEFACESFFWFMFRVRLAGPGACQMPPRGPCIVIANHACWFDPFFLALVLPRPITPMMGSQFYDLPVLRLLMRHVLHVIRVPEDVYKKQGTPEEIVEAIAALDRGECLVVFPEGFLRRSEEKLLKRFGRGIWQILAARPDTPVFCCWIEGAWGSYTSYFNGPPTKNKKRDFRRAIGVAVPPPIAVERTILENHLTTRIFLMNCVLESRGILGLPEVPRLELPQGKDAQD